jgi:hypothetical protein
MVAIADVGRRTRSRQDIWDQPPAISSRTSHKIFAHRFQLAFRPILEDHSKIKD